MLTALYDFLREVDNDFPVSLSSLVDLREYAHKLTSHATLFVSTEKNQVNGCVAIYCNNFADSYAYMPLLAVRKGFRGKHIGRTLMIAAINYAKENGFKTIGVHTENPVALSLYQSLGFKVAEDGKRKYLILRTTP